MVGIETMQVAGIAGLALAVSCCLPGVALATPKPNDLTCTSFMRDYPQLLPAFKVSFERPLTITLDMTGGEDGIEVHILSTNAGVDGTLKCKGDVFRRFEVRVDTPVSDESSANLAKFEQGALGAVFHWDQGKIGTIVGAMSSDAAEYLQASIERGDTYHAGKVEYHQGGRYDIGLIWTDTDHTFVVASQDEP